MVSNVSVYASYILAYAEVSIYISEFSFMCIFGLTSATSE
jgi:hypothetical protein